MVNYYEVLQISSGATRVEVKTAFRSMAKKYHPDFHPDRSEWAHDRMHEILRAYEVLIDAGKRAVYDRTLSRFRSFRETSYRETLKRKGADLAARSKLLFLDLLEGRGSEGVAVYERLASGHPGFELKDHLGVGDSLDCEFLIAEEYERQHRTTEAFNLYSRIFREDEKYRYFGHFREEILLRLRNLVLQFLETDGCRVAALRGFAEHLSGVLNRRERAFIYKKMAECFQRSGEDRLARLTLIAALQLHPRLGGIKKLRRKLKMQRMGLR